MGEELKWLLEERGGHIFLRGVIDGGGRIFKSCDISSQNTPTSHVVSRALLM